MLKLKVDNEEQTKLKLQKESNRLSFPLHEDPNFQKKISLKKEFQLKYDGNIQDVVEKSKDVCEYRDDNFELAPHQEFVKRFMNPETPYNGLLLYHGLGSGKTCSAIGIAEQHRKVFKEYPDFKKIIIIASPNVQENFKLQLFDKNKLEKKGDTWRLSGCVGQKILNELNEQNIDELTYEELVAKIETMINNSYVFMGYERFANFVLSKMNKVTEKNVLKRQKIIKHKLELEFKNRMVIIDEAHNIRLIGDTNKVYKKVATILLMLFDYVKKLKLVLLTGTPMYNDAREIVFLINLLNMNDNRPIIFNKQIFDKDGNIKESGKEKLVDRLNGYVSYVRGENPYSFPYKVLPHETQLLSDYSIKEKEYPSIQFNSKKIDEKIQYLDIYVNGLSELQREAYAHLSKGIESEDESSIDESISPIADDVETRKDLEEKQKSSSYLSIMELLSILNICYPNYDEKSSLSFTHGKRGFKHIMTYKEIKTRDKESNVYPKKYDFEYKPYVKERLYAPENIGKYSHKIRSIIEHVQKSTGIVLIYSQFIDSGLIPIALALEELGFKRANKNNLMKSPLNKSYNVDKEEGKFKQGKYCIISGDKSYSQNNVAELAMVTNPANKYGENVKVVLISQAGSEGLDFKCLRQVHILEPWYNMNRIEQIIGRAVRNCSHKALPLEERNVQIFMHGTIDERTPEQEYIDLYVYRYAENKAIKIGKVLRMMKESSIDCILNYEQQNFTVENMNQQLDQKLSIGEILKINVGDKVYSSQCDYMDSCSFKCNNVLSNNTELDTKSLNVVFLENDNIIEEIKRLILKKSLYKKDELVSLIMGKYKNIQVEEIMHSLNMMTSDENFVILDKYMRKGVLRQVNTYVYFQPLEFGLSQVMIDEITKPIQQKVKKLLIKHKKEDRKANSINRTNAVDNLPESDKSNIVDEVNDMIQRSTIEIPTRELKKERDFYKLYTYCSKMLKSLLTNTDETFETIMKEILMQHMIETMERDNLLKYLYYLLKNNKSDNLNEYEIIALKYFQPYLLEDKENSKTFVVLANIKELIKKVPLDIYYYDDSIESNTLEVAQKQDYTKFKQEIMSMIGFTLPNQSSFVAYMELYKKENRLMLKAKGPLRGVVSSGFYVEQKGKKDVLKMIEIVLGINSVPNNIMKMNKIPHLVMLVEMLMRYLDIIKANNRRHFLTTHEYLFSKKIKN